MPYYEHGLGKTEFTMNNSWVVLYSPDLLRKFRCHMNVELCISRVGSIEYLSKYICKCPDRVRFQLKRSDPQEVVESNQVMVPTIDEIQHYQDARCISASEAAWRFFHFQWLNATHVSSV